MILLRPNRPAARLRGLLLVLLHLAVPAFAAVAHGSAAEPPRTGLHLHAEQAGEGCLPRHDETCALCRGLMGPGLVAEAARMVAAPPILQFAPRLDAGAEGSDSRVIPPNRSPRAPPAAPDAQ